MWLQLGRGRVREERVVARGRARVQGGRVATRRRGRLRGAPVAAREAWPEPRGTCGRKVGVARSEEDIWRKVFSRVQRNNCGCKGCGRVRWGCVAARGALPGL